MTPFLFIYYINFKNICSMETTTNVNTEKIREAYEAPKCEIIEMQQEGVLCQSGKHKPYEEDPFTW